MNYNSHPKMKYLYIGIDCHKYTHTAAMINCFNEMLGVITFDNSKNGYESLIKKVDSVKENLSPMFGIEDTKHLGYGLTQFLLNNDYSVKHVGSHLTANERKKYAANTKTDEVDSLCIAKVLLDELDNLNNAENNEIYWTLKQLNQMRENITKDMVGIKNKLHAQLLHHYPNYNTVFTDISSPTALLFFEKYPSPNLLDKTTEEELNEFFHTNTKYKRYKEISPKIISLLNTYDIKVKEYLEERNDIIKMLIRQINYDKERIEQVDEDISKLYNKLNKKLHTIPCISTVMASALLAEIGNINRFSNSSKLARYAGIAPIEKSSGGKEHAMKSEFGNRKLNSLIYRVAYIGLSTGKTSGDNLKATNPIFREYYEKKISEGKTKHQALICIMRRLVNIICKVLKEDIEYQSPDELVSQCKISFRERVKQKEEKLKKKQQLKEKNLHKVNG